MQVKTPRIGDLRAKELEKVMFEICDHAYPASNCNGKRINLSANEIRVIAQDDFILVKLAIMEGIEHRLSIDISVNDACLQIRKESENFDEESNYYYYSIRTMNFLDEENITKYFNRDLHNPFYRSFRHECD